MIKTIIFDMDGTLLNSDELIFESYRVVFAHHQPERLLTKEFLNTLLAPSYHEVFAAYFPQVKEELLLEDYMRVQKQKRSSLLSLFPQVIEMLTWLKNHQYQIALITSEVRTITQEELKETKIIDYFDIIITSDDVKTPKPSPEGVFKILETFQIHSSDVLYFGDQRTDWEAARAAQVHLGAVSWTNLGIEEMMRYEPELIIAQWMDLPCWLEKQASSFALPIAPDFILKARPNQPFRLLQLTDLHLMNNPLDNATFQWIQLAVRIQKPDLIIITGDLTMDEHSVQLYSQLKLVMDSLSIPWTFTFGNHDRENNISYTLLLEALNDSTHLLFTNGPKDVIGVGNFTIQINQNDGTPMQLLILLDSHSDHMYPVQGQLEWGYERLHFSQNAWVDRVLSSFKKTNLQLKNMLFFHIPIPEYHLANSLYKDVLQGDNNEGPSSSKFGSGLFDVLVKHGSTQAVFVGHDHLNDYAFIHQGIMLAFGRVSGHYDYALPGFPKGARLIDIFQQDSFTTHIIFKRDYEQ